jgi:structural maintenance of chromosome 4
VPESGDEDETDSPPVKKARPSLDPADLKDDEEGESDFLPKPKGRRTATAKRGKPVANGRTAGRTGRMSRSTTVDEASDGQEDSDDEVKPVRTNGRASKRSTEDDAMYDSDEDSKPVRKPKSTAKARTSRAAPKARAKHVIEDSDDSDDGEGSSIGPHAKPKAENTQEGQDGDMATADSTAAIGGHVEEEEDEKSLFDPPPMPTPSSLPQTMAEEPAGPKSRLVIHKMVLVNFKSYAGRQEIGPFHKVSVSITLLSAINSLLSLVIFFYRRPQWLRKIQHYRRSSVRVWVSSLEDETGQVIRAYPQLCALSRPSGL